MKDILEEAAKIVDPILKMGQEAVIMTVEVPVPENKVEEFTDMLHEMEDIVNHWWEQEN